MKRESLNTGFESFVNLEWCKTGKEYSPNMFQFESFVNLEWCKTIMITVEDIKSLRALLIQNGVKP